MAGGVGMRGILLQRLWECSSNTLLGEESRNLVAIMFSRKQTVKQELRDKHINTKTVTNKCAPHNLPLREIKNCASSSNGSWCDNVLYDAVTYAVALVSTLHLPARMLLACDQKEEEEEEEEPGGRGGEEEFQNLNC